jgi:phosphatidylinositol alpha-mannosyltransferase
MRHRLEMDIWQYGLDAECMLLGQATLDDVSRLLGVSDIFLYSGPNTYTHASSHKSSNSDYHSMTVLEAMSSGCAIVASTEPTSNTRLLADGRGIIVPSNDAAAMATALVELCSNPQQRARMGHLARLYILTHHTSDLLKRTLLRSTRFTPTLQVAYNTAVVPQVAQCHF